MTGRLRFVVRTPHETVVDEPLRGARVPAASGQVGLRPGQEPFVFVVEPGLVLLHRERAFGFLATAGGLLDAGTEVALLHTPFAVAGERGEDVLAALDVALATPDSELLARRRLGELEQSIVRELGHRPAGPRGERA